jgi:DnaJ-class molecular chaperone
VQHLVHDPVLNKAYEVRSAEITRELPQVSAVELNQAYYDIYGKSRPQDWNIQATMTPYQILEILPEASLNMIQRIYRIIAREVHPDTYKGSKEKANEMMTLLNNAYQRLQKEKLQRENFHNDIP